MVNNSFKRLVLLSLSISMIAIVISCGNDDGADSPLGEPVASFDGIADDNDYATIDFVNASQNATSYEWDFGDGSEVSTDENPSHTYAEDGTYTVTLTASNGAEEDVATKDFTISDPNAAQELLSGTTSKTWKLMRSDDPALYKIGGAAWPGVANADGLRPCIYDDGFTFNADGTYTVDNNDSWWAEYGVHNNNPDCPDAGDKTDTIEEQCLDITGQTSLVNECGADVSAWLGSDEWTYVYDPATDKITLNGTGAWIGIPKLTTTEEGTTPEENVQFTAEVIDGGSTGVDTLKVFFDHGGDDWFFTYVSYDNAADEPTLVTEPPACESLAASSATSVSHTFVSNDAAEWEFLQYDESSGSTVEFGVTDPDGGGTAVGKITRVAGTQYQEAIFQLDPAASFNFSNTTQLTFEVYISSTSNTFSEGGLQDNLIVGFGNRTCPLTGGKMCISGLTQS